MQLSPTQSFLRAVLPEEGLKCAAIFRGRAPTHRFTASFDELEDILLTEDALGYTTYHACASYKTADSRTGDNVLGARSLWLDIDAGDTAIEKWTKRGSHGPRPPADTQEAAEMVARFCAAAHLPPPVFVGSGAGLHVYWPLERSLTRTEWFPYASGLRQLCHVHGLPIDPARTADIASILRTPGTHWRKSEPARVVRAGSIIPGPYSLRLFERLNDVAPLLPARRATAPLTGLAAALANTQTYDPVSSDDVADGCAQLAAVRDSGGTVPEPHWYAALGVLAFCEDGEEKSHEWSSGYEGYSARETGDKFARAKRLSGATTCAHFANVGDPSVCQRCPLFGRINSPIAIRGERKWEPSVSSQPSGSGQPESDSSVAPSPSGLFASSFKQATSPGNESEKTGGIDLSFAPKPVDPFAWGDDGSLIWLGEDKRGSAQRIVVSRYPIYLDSVQKGEVNGDSFSYRFRQFLPKEGWIEIGLTAEAIMGLAGIPKLFGKGAAIREKELFKDYIVLSIDKFNTEQNLKMRFDQFGWKADESGFLYGKNLYTAAGTESAIGAEEVKVRSQFLVPKTGGSLEKWSAAASSLFAKDCEAQSFALLSAFAAPLMRFHATAEGGAVVSLVSERSGTGKTTALTAAASVWGRLEGLSLTNIDTDVSKALTLSALGNLPVIYDEFYNRDPEIVKKFIIVFTNGRDKMRGTVDGTIRHTQASWQTVLLSASNLSLIDLVNSVGGTDAPGFRILEFTASLPHGLTHQRGDGLRKDLEQNSGYAGDKFLRYLVQPDVLAFVRKAIPAWTDDIWKKTELTSEHRFRVRAIASVAVAATIVQKLGILPFSPQRIVDWAMEQAKGYRDDAPITGIESTAVRYLAEFLNEHAPNALVLSGPWRANDPNRPPLLEPRAKLLIRYEKSNGRLIVAQMALRDWLTKKGVGYRSFMDDMMKQNIVLEKSRQFNLGVGTNYPSGLMPCVEISMNHPKMSGVVIDAVKLGAVG